MTLIQKKNQTENIFFYYAIYLLTLLTTTFLISCIGFFLGIEVSVAHFPFAIVLSNIILFYNLRSLVKATAALQYLVAINLLLVAVFFICINIYDTTHDGLWYHQPAIIKLAEGWNPIKNPFYVTNQYDKSNFLWIQHYPKASWIIASSIYKMTGLLESGKLINFISVFAIFFYSFHVFSKIFKERLIYILSFSILISLNPVATSQLLSDYLDGILSGMLSLVLLSLINMQLPDDRSPKWNWFVLLSAIVIITNLKFTGLFMAGIIIGIFSILWWWKREPVNLILKKYLLIGLVSISSFFVFGFNPYYSNLSYKGHSFYPLNVDSVYKIVERNEPDVLNGRSNFSKFYISVFSESNNITRTKEITWKNPVIVTKAEIRAFAGTDVRLGGFGPLFVLAFFLSIVAFIIYFKDLSKNSRVLILISAIAILLSVVFIPTAWWARHTPQFFFLPLLLLVFPCSLTSSAKNKFKKYLPAFVLGIYFINILLIAAPYLSSNFIKTRLIKHDMKILASRKKPLLINFSKTELQALRMRLKEAGVSFTDADTLTTNTRELRSIYNFLGTGPVYLIDDDVIP